MTAEKNIKWTESQISPEKRAKLLGQRGCVLWLTGLSGSGKTTIARKLEEHLMTAGHPCYVLDGDNIRHGLNSDLGFSETDRTENIRRISEVSGLFADAGLIVITSFISPFKEDRQRARHKVPEGAFIEIYLDTSLEVCEKRDPKNLYKKARKGEIPDFTGISSPYESPDKAEIVLDTGKLSLEDCINNILDYFLKNNIIAGKPGAAGR
jgi:adenylylsulfate kinase